MAQPDRLENLEEVVRALRAEVAELRAELRRLGGEAGVAPPSGAGLPTYERVDVGTAARPAATAPASSLGAWGAPPEIHDTAARAAGQHRADAERGEGSPFAPPPPPGAEGEPDAGPPFAPAFEPRRGATPPFHDRRALESLVGRYGTLALGALALVMALGAWLSWAIENYELSDAARVALGAVAAAAVGGVGLWLRRRGTVRFGNVLLGIALALVHVDAWGAGPVLRVVPTGVALAIAALASAVLAVLAYRDDEQSLFVVAIGGALAAPFVTTDGTGSTILLLLYGWLVLGGAIYALRGRPWPAAHWLVLGGTFVYAVIGAVRDPAAGSPWYLRDAPLFFALNVALTAWAAEGGERRGLLARQLLYVALVPALIYHDRPAVFVDRIALAFGATLLTALAVREAGAERRVLVDRLALPLLFLVAALVGVLPVHPPPTIIGAGVALLWAGAAAVAALSAPRGSAERGVDLAVAGIASAAALPLGLGDDGIAAPIALAGHAALFALVVVRREPQRIVALPVVLALAVAAAWSEGLLGSRVPYEYTPFATGASLAAGATVAATALAGWLLTRRDLRAPLGVSERGALAVGAVAPTVAFLWGNQELAYAGSPSVASFALIAYWAACGVLAISVGRWRAIPAARQVGLALSILAALKAVSQAAYQQSIGLRIGSYLVVGVFLLAVAYWYRAAGGEPAEAG